MNMNVFQKENMLDFMALFVVSKNKPGECLEDSDEELEPSVDSRGRRVPENTESSDPFKPEVPLQTAPNYANANKGGQKPFNYN